MSSIYMALWYILFFGFYIGFEYNKQMQLNNIEESLNNVEDLLNNIEDSLNKITIII
jgi:hypothetical protein